MEEKIYQSMLMLTVHDEFIFDVEKLREKYNIDWIAGDEEKRFYDYCGGGYKTMNSQFKNQIEEYDYDNFEINEKGEGVGYMVLDSYKKYLKDLETLMKKYNLTSDYTAVVDVYVQQDFILGDSGMTGSKSNSPEIDDDKDYVVVKVFPNTTKKEYMNDWKISQFLLESHFEGKQFLTKSADNTERDVEIMKLKKSGKTAPQIVRIINDSGKYENKLSGYLNVEDVVKNINNRIARILAY